jgi:hypothetical protein
MQFVSKNCLGKTLAGTYIPRFQWDGVGCWKLQSINQSARQAERHNKSAWRYSNVCVCVCMYIFWVLEFDVSVQMQMYAHMHTNMYVYVYVCVYVCVCNVRMYYVYACMHLCTHVCLACMACMYVMSWKYVFGFFACMHIISVRYRLHWREKGLLEPKCF